jgi:hypothetical protein
MVDKEEIIAKREEKRHREKEATCAQFDLTKKAIEVEESLKTKAIEDEAKLLVVERHNPGLILGTPIARDPAKGTATRSLFGYFFANPIIISPTTL